MASTTFLKLAKRAMRLLGVLEVGLEPTADEEQDLLEGGNAMVDAFALERLLIYTVARSVFALNAGQASYEIGPNADPTLGWVAQRPTYIEGAGLLFSLGSQTSEQPIQILTPAEWRRERLKGFSTSLVTKLFYDHGFTNPNSAGADVGSGTVFPWPIPAGVGAIALYLPQSVLEFTSINQAVALPAGYKRALAYNLAVEIAGEFDTTPSDTIVAIAMESKALIKRANFHPEKLGTGLGTGGGGGFNIYVGE